MRDGALRNRREKCVQVWHSWSFSNFYRRRLFGRHNLLLNRLWSCLFSYLFYRFFGNRLSCFFWSRLFSHLLSLRSCLLSLCLGSGFLCCLGCFFGLCHDFPV